jgi:uncharacterized protein
MNAQKNDSLEFQPLTRRRFGASALALSVATAVRGTLMTSPSVGATASASPALPHSNTEKLPGPQFWMVERGSSRVYLLGVREAKDGSWLTPKITRAFADSSEFWLETPPHLEKNEQTPPAPAQQPAAPAGNSEDRDDALARELGRDLKRNLFDVLGPRLALRTKACADEYGIAYERLAPLRPWRAYYVINDGFRSHAGMSAPEVNPQAVLTDMAVKASKPIYSEFANLEASMRWFAALSDEAEREHIEDLLDYIDAQKSGQNHDEDVGWMSGNPSDRTITEMRTKRPVLYEVTHVSRNIAWAERIDRWLAKGGVYFVCMGMNHMLGPNSIPQKLSLRKDGLRRI